MSLVFFNFLEQTLLFFLAHPCEMLEILTYESQLALCKLFTQIMRIKTHYYTKYALKLINHVTACEQQHPSFFSLAEHLELQFMP